jgi:hypothetical protein
VLLPFTTSVIVPLPPEPTGTIPSPTLLMANAPLLYSYSVNTLLSSITPKCRPSGGAYPVVV